MAEENKAEQKSSAKADAQEKLESSRTHARKAAEDLRAAAGAIAGEYRGKAEQAWGEARDKAEEAWDDARDRVRTFQEDAEQYVRENPTKAVWTALAAAGLHFVIALALLLVARSRMIKPLFRSTASELKKDREWLKNLDTTNQSTS